MARSDYIARFHNRDEQSLYGPVDDDRLPFVREATPSSDDSDDSDEDMEREGEEEGTSACLGSKRTRDLVDDNFLEKSSAGPSQRRRLIPPFPVASRRVTLRHPRRSLRINNRISLQIRQEEEAMQLARDEAEAQAAAKAEVQARIRVETQARLEQEVEHDLMLQRQRLPLVMAYLQELREEEEQELREQEEQERQQQEQAVMLSQEPESLRRSKRINQAVIPRTRQEIISAVVPAITYNQACTAHQRADDSDECAICLGRFKPKTRVRILDCGHVFHKDCIDHWYKEDRGRCPLCRTAIVPA